MASRGIAYSARVGIARLLLDARDAIHAILDLDTVCVVHEAGEAQVVLLERLQVAEQRAVGRPAFSPGISSGMPGG